MVGGIGFEGERAGLRTLRLLAAPLSATILDELARGPRHLRELRRELGSPPARTLRGRTAELSRAGAVVKRRPHPFPSVREHVLANGPGTELRFVADVLRGWLASAPDGPLELGGESAGAAVDAVAEGWATGILRAVATRPTAAAELGSRSGSLGAASLERRFMALRDAGLLAEARSSGRHRAYAASDWLRRAVAPLAAAIRWEAKHLPGLTPPVGPDQAETGFLLAIPLLRLPVELSGSCRLGVEFGEGRERRLAGVTLEVDRGAVVSCEARLESGTAGSATGPPHAWLRLAIEADPSRLDVDGDRRLVLPVLDGLNRALFAPLPRSPRGG
jgi:DNA-binding HxlR family transcriptional regulator